jgi:phosphate acyltransferase
MNNINLAIDIESGDFGPDVVISGLLEAKRVSTSPFKPYLCGDQYRIQKIIKDHKFDSSLIGDYEIVHCPDSISPDDKRASVWKKRAGSSIIRSIALQKEGVVDASVSAGDTAILLGAALFILGRSEGALRPALAALLPTVKKKPVLLLDVGANLNCRPEHLVSFGMLGTGYMSHYCGITLPAVALLNVGKEQKKGTRVVCDAGEVLKKRHERYIGFIEGNGVLSGDADVVVCDGFVGNALLKAYESFYVLAESILEKDQKLLVKLKDHMTVLDPENYGAVPFLGIKGTVLKAHGGSSPHAIANAIITAITAVKKDAVWSKNVRPKGN